MCSKADVKSLLPFNNDEYVIQGLDIVCGMMQTYFADFLIVLKVYAYS